MSENIQKRIVDRLINLLHEIDFSYDRLASYLQLSETPRRKIRVTTQSMPSSLHFSSRSARTLVNQFGPGKEFEIEDVAKALKLGLSKKQDYEIILAMAYILGTLNKWEVAEGFCSYALHLGRKSNQPINEGKFFLAMCKRKVGSGQERESFFDAQKLLDEAIESLPTEPRYLKEKGLQILLMDLLIFEKRMSHLVEPLEASTE